MTLHHLPTFGITNSSGLESKRSTFLPLRARLVPRLTVVVVFPTPPFCVATEMIFVLLIQNPFHSVNPFVY